MYVCVYLLRGPPSQTNAQIERGKKVPRKVLFADITLFTANTAPGVGPSNPRGPGMHFDTVVCDQACPLLRLQTD